MGQLEYHGSESAGWTDGGPMMSNEGEAGTGSTRFRGSPLFLGLDERQSRIAGTHDRGEGFDCAVTLVAKLG